MPSEWEKIAWKAQGGYGNQGTETNGRKNAGRERIWFSPHCLRPGLFSLEIS
jgi:DNA adenine methylase